MTAIEKPKPDYKCLTNERIYKTTKSDGSCYSCRGECPVKVKCVMCGELFLNSEVRRVVPSRMQPCNINQARWKEHLHEKSCAPCFDRENNRRIGETTHRNIWNKSQGEGEGWRVERHLNLYRADSVFGPLYGHQLLIETQILTFIHGELVSTVIDRQGREMSIIGATIKACEGWESINSLRQRS